MNNITDLQVLHDENGYYIGKEICYNNIYTPYSRHSQYFETESEAKQLLITLITYGCE